MAVHSFYVIYDCAKQEYKNINYNNNTPQGGHCDFILFVLFCLFSYDILWFANEHQNPVVQQP